jgi:hypothetical protein
VGVRIQVDPASLEQPGFAGINQGIIPVIPAVRAALGSAAGACGSPSLAGAISDLSDALGTADQAAGVSVNGLGVAASKAAQQYRANEAVIAHTEGYR